MVRIGEKAFKMVKARPKRVSKDIVIMASLTFDCFVFLGCWHIVQGQSALDSLQNSTVEVFGRWQTEVYMAPPVVNVSAPPPPLSLSLSLVPYIHSVRFSLSLLHTG